jgi:hypothetical protein
MAMSDVPGPLNFDRNHLRRVLRTAALACIIVWIAAIAILLLVDPSGSQCPGWNITTTHGSSHSIWGLVGMITTPAVLVICYYALRWKRLAQKIESSSGSNKRWSNFVPWMAADTINPRTFPYNRLFTCVGIGWTFCCAQPLFTMVESCIKYHEHYLGFSIPSILAIGWFIIFGGFVIAYVGGRNQ